MDTLEYQSMYYTFSTIAQVLAAFIALSGVFVIFKVQYLRKTMLYHANKFLHKIGNIQYKIDLSSIEEILLSRLEEKIESGSTSEILDMMNKLLDNPKLNELQDEKEILKTNRFFFARINSDRKLLLGLTKISLFTGILTIFYSIYILAIVYKTICVLTDWVYYIRFTGIVVSIGFMVWAILMALRETKIGNTERLIKKINRIENDNN